jgi:hypothetical protein
MGEPGPGDPTIVAGSVGGLLASEFWSYVGVELFWRGVDCRDGSEFVLFGSRSDRGCYRLFRFEGGTGLRSVVL